VRMATWLAFPVRGLISGPFHDIPWRSGRGGGEAREQQGDPPHHSTCLREPAWQNFSHGGATSAASSRPVPSPLIENSWASQPRALGRHSQPWRFRSSAENSPRGRRDRISMPVSGRARHPTRRPRRLYASLKLTGSRGAGSISPLGVFCGPCD